MHPFIILSLVGMISNPQVSRLGFTAQDVDTFATYAYTFGDIVIFSYGDSNQCEILDDEDNQVWSGILNRDEYTLQTVAEGVYKILGSREFSVLTGDPFNELVQGWYAVDENARPLSTKFLTVIQGSWLSPPHAGEEKFCVFAYYDNTSVTVKDLDVDTIVWEGDLDSAGYWQMRNLYANGIPVSVEATRPVSVLSYGDCGYYAPAYNGTFTGRDFLTFCGDIGATTPWDQALKVIPWEDDVNVVVTDLDNPADTLWKFHVDDRGDVQSQNFVGRFLAVHADKDISCALVPGTTFNYFHLVRCIDRDGLGLGTLFYIPVYQTTAMMTGNLDIFAFNDNTEVEVFKLPENTEIWSGTLQRGEHHRLMTEYYATYKVEASRIVSVIESDGDQGGADFLPLWFAIHPAIAAYPSPQLRETYQGVPVSETEEGCYEVYVENNGNFFDVINIFATHSDSVNFTSVLTDEYGGSLPDCDGDGNPDTDTLPRGGSFVVLVDVIPSDTVPVGTVDTCFFRVVSSRDTTKCDTAFLITRIIPGSVSEKPAARLPEFNLAFGQNVLYVSNPSKEELRLDFFDVLGRRVMSRTIQESQASVDVSAFPKGVYFISVRTGESGRITRKLVVCR